MNDQLNELFTKIAQEHLNFETLEERKSDSLDFKEVGVLNVRAALEAAYKAGKSAAIKPDYNNSKHQILIELLQSDSGATLQQMADATGWRKHSVSCALSAVLKNKWNLNISCTRRAGKESIYRISSTI